MQNNKNESSWRQKKKITTFYCIQAKDMRTCKKINKIIYIDSWQDTQRTQTQCKSSHMQKSQPSSCIIMHNRA